MAKKKKKKLNKRQRKQVAKLIFSLILLVIIMIKDFLSKNKLAGYLQIPYLIWLFIAAILNLIIIM